MTELKYSARWLWFMVRRYCAYSLYGALFGAIWGAACISVAGCIIGLSTITAHGVEAFAFAMFGGFFGLFFGAATGGIIGLLGWGVVGVIYPTSSMLSTKNALFDSTTVWMRNATIFAVACYFSWCVCIGFMRNGFGAAVYDYLYIALFAVPALMGVGQIAGIWCAAIQLQSQQTAI